MTSIYSRIQIILFIISSYTTKYYIQKVLHNNESSSKIRAKEEQERIMECCELSLGRPIWKMGAERWSRPLQRDFPRETSAVRVDAELGSSTEERFWGVTAGLAISSFQNNLMGLREIFIFPLLGEERILLAQEDQEQAKQLHVFDIPSSKTSEFCAPVFDDVSLQGVPPWSIRLLLSFAVHQRKITRSQQAHRSFSTWPAHAVCTRLHEAYKKLNVMLSGMATNSERNVKSDSEKKLFYVKQGLRTKSCTQTMTPHTCRYDMATQSRLITNLLQGIAGPRTTSAVKRNHWNFTFPEQSKIHIYNCSTAYMIGYDAFFIQVLPSSKTSISRTERQDFPYVKASPQGRPHQLQLFLNEGLVLSPARFNFAPSCPPFLQ